MKLNAPAKITFVISLVLFVLALVGHFASVSFVSEQRFWLAVFSWVVLAAGCFLKKV
ncbi:MAG TPA: hypothetical protein PLA50_06840 [Bacteroidia bacterium]|nr:hypothetical protein [Bacteroidia bacterium]